MISSSSCCSNSQQNIKLKKKHKTTEEMHVLYNFETTENEELYFDLSGSTLSCVSNLEYADSNLNVKVALVNRSKSFQEAGATIPVLKKQRLSKKYPRSNQSYKMSDVENTEWTLKDQDDNDLSICCDNKGCRLIKKKRFYERFFNQIRNISQDCRKNIQTEDHYERGELYVNSNLYSF